MLSTAFATTCKEVAYADFNGWLIIAKYYCQPISSYVANSINPLQTTLTYSRYCKVWEMSLCIDLLRFSRCIPICSSLFPTLSHPLLKDYYLNGSHEIVTSRKSLISWGPFFFEKFFRNRNLLTAGRSGGVDGSRPGIWDFVFDL